MVGVEIATYSDFLPFVVIAFKEVDAVLDGDDAGSPFADFRLRRESKIYSSSERHDGGYRWGVAILVMTKRAAVKDAVHLLEVTDGGVPQVDVGLLDVLGQFSGVLVHVVQVVVELGILCNGFCETVAFTTLLASCPPLLSDHVFNSHVLVFYNEASFPTPLVINIFDFTLAACEQPALLGTKHNNLRLFLIGGAGHDKIVFRFKLGSLITTFQFCLHQFSPKPVQSSRIQKIGRCGRRFFPYDLTLRQIRYFARIMG